MCCERFFVYVSVVNLLVVNIIYWSLLGRHWAAVPDARSKNESCGIFVSKNGEDWKIGDRQICMVCT